MDLKKFIDFQKKKVYQRKMQNNVPDFGNPACQLDLKKLIVCEKKSSSILKKKITCFEEGFTDLFFNKDSKQVHRFGKYFINLIKVNDF